MNDINHLRGKRVLVVVLNWGLGHATRCLPIIQELQKQGAEVMVGSDGIALDLLKTELPDTPAFALPPYDIHYQLHGSFALTIARQLGKMQRAIRREHEALEELVQAHDIDWVISDNRYGCWSKHVPSTFMTHQLMIRMPRLIRWLNKLTWTLVRRHVLRYDSCWIPDFPNPNESLAGEMVHAYPLPPSARFLGPLSRYHQAAGTASLKYDFIAVLSGPEPQRTLLEEKIVAQVKDSPYRGLIVRGLPHLKDRSKVRSVDGQRLTMVPYLNASQLREAISAAKVVVCRSGYSSIMDLYYLQKPAILIPTPGQTEQEYLGRRLHESGRFLSVAQSRFRLLDALREVDQYPGFGKPSTAHTRLSQVIAEFAATHLSKVGTPSTDHIRARV